MELDRRGVVMGEHGWVLRVVLTAIFLICQFVSEPSLSAGEPRRPCAIALDANGTQAYVACAEGNRVVTVDLENGRIRSTFQNLPSPSGLVLSTKGSHLWVVYGGPSSFVSSLEVGAGKETWRIPVGHTAMAPITSSDQKRLYVCNRFNNDVSVIDLIQGRELHRIEVAREPVAAALSPDDRLLVVANHLHRGRADAPLVAAEVSVIDTRTLRLLKHIQLPNGSGLSRGVAISPDGRFAAITHVLARYYLPTVELNRGWINNNALSIVDLQRLECLGTVVLDDLDRGAANPWGVVWTSQGDRILVTHAGTHEVSIIEAPRLLERIQNRAHRSTPLAMANDPLLLAGLRQRVEVKGEGPRALVLCGPRLVVANFFSDDLSLFDSTNMLAPVRVLPLGDRTEWTDARRGEALFNDARICYQNWQSCASCHSSDARTDGLNWDLLNDGVGNPKNTKSLVWSALTPPSMSQGVRSDSKAAVRAGLEHILFQPPNEGSARLIDIYLESLVKVPSPYLRAGLLSPAARRGKELFFSKRTGCSRCHPEGLYTDLHSHDVGSASGADTSKTFDTPTLIELWRTAPYLHDGSAATLQELFSQRNPQDQHGHTRGLTPGELQDLIQLLLSL